MDEIGTENDNLPNTCENKCERISVHLEIITVWRGERLKVITFQGGEHMGGSTFFRGDHHKESTFPREMEKQIWGEHIF